MFYFFILGCHVFVTQISVIFPHKRKICSYHFIVYPRLIATHSVAPHQFHWSHFVTRVQAVVIGHDLLAFCVGEYLVAPEIVAVSHSQVFTRFSSHRVQTTVCLNISYLSGIKNTFNDPHITGILKLRNTLVNVIFKCLQNPSQTLNSWQLISLRLLLLSVIICKNG